MNLTDPTVSILMPMRNEKDYIGDVLETIRLQDYRRDLIEVVVVDGLSNDGSTEVARSYGKALVEEGFRGFSLVMNPARNTPAALNLALEHSTGDVLVRVDGHCRIQQDYVRRCVQQLRDLGADNVGGGWRSLGRTRTGKAVALATVSRFGVGGASFRYSDKPGWAPTVYLGAYRREVFEEIGLFDEELIRNQDDEFNLRLIQAGGRIWYDPELKTDHFAREDFVAHLRQHYEFGLYKVRVMQKRRTVPALRHLVPAGFVAALGTSVAVSLMTRRPRWAAPVIVPYLTAASCAACVAGRGDPGLIPRITVAFVLMHVGYGAGTVAGVFKWRRHFRRDARA